METELKASTMKWDATEHTHRGRHAFEVTTGAATEHHNRRSECAKTSGVATEQTDQASDALLQCAHRM